MKRWKPNITEKKIVQHLALFQIVYLWGYGLTHWLVGTLVVSTAGLLWALRRWPEGKE